MPLNALFCVGTIWKINGGSLFRVISSYLTVFEPCSERSAVLAGEPLPASPEHSTGVLPFFKKMEVNSVRKVQNWCMDLDKDAYSRTMSDSGIKI